MLSGRNKERPSHSRTKEEKNLKDDKCTRESKRRSEYRSSLFDFQGLKRNPEAIQLRGCSSVGRAPALQAGGQEFESLHLHQDERSSEKDGHKTKGKHTDTGS